MQWLSWDVNLKTRLIGETLFNLLFWMYFPFITIYFSEAFGPVIAGVMMTVPSVISIFGSMIGGYVTDRLGRRPTMLIGSFMQVVMFALFALSLSHWWDYISFVGISLGKSLYRPASAAMVADLVSKKERRQVFATFVTANNLGAVLGPVIGAVLFFNYRSELLWTCTLVTLCYSIAIFFMVRETMPKEDRKVEYKSGVLSVIKGQWMSYYVIFRDKVFFLYILGGIFITVSIMQLDLYLAVYVNDHVPTQDLVATKNLLLTLSSEEVFGWMLGLNGLMFVFCVVPVMKLLKKWSDRNTLILATVLSGLGMFLVSVTSNAWLLFLFTFIFTLGEIIHAPVVQNFVSTYAPKNARGQYMGASDLQFSVGRFIAPVTVILSATMSPLFVFGFILACALVSAGLYFVLFRVFSENDPMESICET
ncbi:MDR family MFS transporter [Oceanobacillus limi]|uniref:MDR family MFS transporter n=1 Tax=Oceanobacillus limi TaxID=930131 RepID=UPI000B811E17|nr:MFS transporter [Oceanobacillus limi]